jgi:hypothetical protein
MERGNENCELTLKTHSRSAALYFALNRIVETPEKYVAVASALN